MTDYRHDGFSPAGATMDLGRTVNLTAGRRPLIKPVPSDLAFSAAAVALQREQSQRVGQMTATVAAGICVSAAYPVIRQETLASVAGEKPGRRGWAALANLAVPGIALAVMLGYAVATRTYPLGVVALVGMAFLSWALATGYETVAGRRRRAARALADEPTVQVRAS